MSDGVVEQTGENVSFRYERRFSRPIEDVWTEIPIRTRSSAGWGAARRSSRGRVDAI